MSSSNFARTIRFAALAVSIVSFALPAQAADRLTAGQYEFTATTDGQTRIVAPRCVTAEEAQNVNADAKTGRESLEKLSQGLCSVTNYEVDRNTVSTSMKCGEDTSSTRTTYHGDGWSEDTVNTLHEGGKTVVHKTHSEAKRVGDCK